MANPAVEDDTGAAGDDEDDWLPDAVDKLTKKKMHEYMLKDEWAIGNEKLAAMEVLFTRGKGQGCWRRNPVFASVF